MKKIYEVYGTVKKGGFTVWLCNVEAANAKDAKAMAVADWETKGRTTRLSHFTAKRVDGAPPCLAKWIREDDLN